ncbi:hypothetical protein ACEQPO_09025 [Bacillus sp. SL00103]
MDDGKHTRLTKPKRRLKKHLHATQDKSSSRRENSRNIPARSRLLGQNSFGHCGSDRHPRPSNAAVTARAGGGLERVLPLAIWGETCRRIIYRYKTQIFDMVIILKEAFKSISQTVKGVELSLQRQDAMDKTSHSFEDIELKAQDIKQEMAVLNDQIVQSTELGGQVLNSIENISAVVEETALGSEEISASANEQAQSFHQMNKQVEELMSMTARLNETVHRFKLS